MKTIYKHFLLSLVAAAILTLVGSGCATTKGFGEDVENLGENIQGE